MSRRWNKAEEIKHRAILADLYVRKNLPLREVARHLRMSESGAYTQLLRLKIPIAKERKLHYLNRRSDVSVPRYSPALAEFMGIMLGDGHISKFQVIVHLGTKEKSYARYVRGLFKSLFGVAGTIAVRRTCYRDVYIGSILLVRWLREQGLASNKVAAQVGPPKWIFRKRSFMNAFIRGMFDTDGSVYALRYGIQIAFTNRSKPLLSALHSALTLLGYKPSRESAWRVYLTRRGDIFRFFQEICPKNRKHTERFHTFVSMRRSYSGNYSGL